MDPYREIAALSPTPSFGMTAAAMQQMMQPSGSDRIPGVPQRSARAPQDERVPPMGGDFDDFVQRMRELKREALRNAPPARPANPDKPTGSQAGPLDVRAHGFQRGDEFVPVKSIRVFEVGDYSKRSLGTFNGNWFESEYSHRMDGARAGKTYRVVVTWGDGSTQERDVQMQAGGSSVDVWKH